MQTQTDSAKPIPITLPPLYPAQYDAIMHPARYVVIEASTKAGKTLGCLVWQMAQVFSDQLQREHWWVAPVYPQSEIAFRRAKKMLFGLCAANDSKLTLTFRNGARWVFKSGEKPDNLYGDDVADAVIDEASRLREASWVAVRSTLTATRGPIRLIGNVRGRRNWMYSLARRAQAGDNPAFHYAKLTAYDAVAGGVLALEEVEDARSVLSEDVFRELYLAEASDDGANPFGLTIIERQTQEELAPGPAVCFGVDVARKQDWYVIIGLNARRRVCSIDRWRGRSWAETYEETRRICGAAPVLIDATGVGDPVCSELQNRGVAVEPFVFSSASKQHLMESYAMSLSAGLAWVAPGVMAAEIEAFEYSYSPRGGVRYSAPDNEHDDTVCAGALADRLAAQLGLPWVPESEIVEQYDEPSRVDRLRSMR